MPLYKLVGNRLLSWAQNVLAGVRLSEWHSGYRLYRVSTLASVRYASNSNGFGFDTEIILQLLHAGAHITERAIPTYYGDEICRVNGLRYAGQVMAASLGSALHRHGLVHQHRLQPIAVGNDHYEFKLGFASSHRWALDAVPDGSRVLDLRAGPGGLASELARKSCPTTVIDIEPPTKLTPGVVTHVADLNEQLVVPIHDYDYYLMLDVIEHLKDPEAFLDGLRGFWPGLEIGEAPSRPGFFDRAQIQQVLINLVKNAHEAGGPQGEVKVAIETAAEGGCRISVLDRGPGISDEVMQNVFLPFFTTKPSGDGLGLALSREIVELHHGRLGLARRQGGGMSVSVWLPDRETGAAAVLAASRVRLTLTSA